MALLPQDWAEAWSTMSAREFMRWLGTQGISAPHADLLGYEVAADDQAPGRSRMTWRVPQALLNPAGIAHGGFLAAILDDAAGMAIAMSGKRWVPQLTVHLSVDYLAPVMPDRDHVVEGVVIRSGRSTNLADATITDPDGTLLVRGSGVFQPNRRSIPRELWAEAGLA